MKTIEFLFQETEIHFLLQREGEVMVNATEMAKAFGRRTKDFLKTDATKAYIKVAERALNGAHSESKIINDRGHVGIFFDRKLALKFAAWLSPEFEYWVFSTLDQILFGHYKEHWDAHAQQEVARVAMEDIKTEILHNPTPESVAEYFKYQELYKTWKYTKTRAIKNQLKLFK